MAAWSGRMKICRDTSGNTPAIHRCRYQMFASKSKALSPCPCGIHALSQCRSHEPPLAPAAADQTAESGLQTDQGCQHACPVLPGHLWCQRGRGYKNLLGTQFSSVAQSCLTLCDPMDCSTPGLPVHHQLPEFTQTRVHGVGDAIQPSHPLSSPSPPAFNLSQHQSLFQ